MLYDTYRQVYWPPGHPWLVAGAFLVGGVSPVAARSASLVCFLLAVAAIYAAALSLEKGIGEVAAVVAAVLFLTSPGLVAFASLSMLEMPALLCLILTCLVFFRIEPGRSRPTAYVLLGLSITLTYFVKSNYGILVGAVALLGLGLDLLSAPPRLGWRALFYTALPMAIAFAIWFAYPPKVTSTWRALVNYQWGPEQRFGLEALLFYPRAMVPLSGSPFLLAFLVASAIGAVRYLANRNVRLLELLVLVQFLLGTLHHTKLERHLLPILPALFMLAGFVLGKGWHWVGRRRQPLATLALGSITLAVLLGTFLGLGRTLVPGGGMPTLVPTARSYEPELVGWIEAAAERGSLLLVTSMDIRAPHPPGLDWRLVADEGLMDITGSGAIMDWEEFENQARMLRALPLPARLTDQVLPVLIRGEDSRVRSLILGLSPGASSRSPYAFGGLVARPADAHAFDQVAVIASTEADAKYPPAWIEDGLRQAGFVPKSNRLFSDSDLQVGLYRRGGAE